MKDAAGASGGGEDKRFKKNIEYILIYAKQYDEMDKFNNVYKYTEIYELVKWYRENKISWKYGSVLLEEGEKEYFTSTVDGDGNEIKIYKRNGYVTKSIKQVAKEEGISERDVYYKHIELAKTRLSNVINGDKSGISSDENWNGGGSYIYCELAENSQTYIDKIYKANTIEELIDIFNFLKESEFISYRVDINKMKDDDFIQLSIDDAKKVLISIIDKNTLYINYSDIDNEDYVIDDNDKAFTKNFYEGV